MKSFAKSDGVQIVSCVREESVSGAIAAVKNSQIDGATAIDLHLSCLGKRYQNVESIRRIVEASPLPIVGVHYSQNYDGSYFESDEEERIALLMTAVDAGVACIDMQGYSFDRKSKDGFFGKDILSFTKNAPKEIVMDEKIIKRQKDFIKAVHEKGCEVLLSCHPSVAMDHEQVKDLVRFLSERGSDVLKIVTVANTDDEMIEGLKTMVELRKMDLPQKISYHCCGKNGKLTRIVNPVLGSFLCFCTERYKENSVFEQMHLKTTAEFLAAADKLVK